MNWRLPLSYVCGSFGFPRRLRGRGWKVIKIFITIYLLHLEKFVAMLVRYKLLAILMSTSSWCPPSITLGQWKSKKEAREDISQFPLPQILSTVTTVSVARCFASLYRVSQPFSISYRKFCCNSTKIMVTSCLDVNIPLLELWKIKRGDISFAIYFASNVTDNVSCFHCLILCSIWFHHSPLLDMGGIIFKKLFLRLHRNLFKIFGYFHVLENVKKKKNAIAYWKFSCFFIFTYLFVLLVICSSSCWRCSS